MKKKTRVIIGSLIISALLLMFVFPALFQRKTGSFMSEWGKILKEHAVNKSINEPEMYAKGNTATVTEDEIQQATAFYVLSGMDKEAAKIQAINYAMEREALYAAAVRNGYSVTENEVRAYLKELKETINAADNKEDEDAVMKSFGSSAYTEIC